ncbi:MAG TPA: hypothetical protein VJA21_25265 [Verrucomicrobiae bacterium]
MAATIYRTDGGTMCGAVYTSTNAGFTWENNAVSCFQCVRSSADGSKLLAGGCYGSHWGAPNVYVSTNAGASWNPTGGPCPSGFALTAEGTRIYIAVGGVVAASSDLGATWDFKAWPNISAADTIACSADGSKIVVAGYWVPEAYFPGLIFTSVDSGTTWVSNSAPSTAWTSVASSADGAKLAAVVEGGGVYISQSPSTPVLKIGQSGDSLLISWVVPSRVFLLEESADLRKWSGVAVTPALNCTNLNYEVGLAVPPGPRFYRLATP